MDAISGFHLFRAQRENISDAFGAAITVAEIDASPTLAPGSMGLGWVSADDTRLYLVASPAGDQYNANLYLAERPAPQLPFDAPVLLSNVTTPSADHFPAVGSDGLLYFASDRPGGSGDWDIFVAALDGDGLPALPSGLTLLNTGFFEGAPLLSADGKSLFFGSDRPDKQGIDIWVACRNDVLDAFGEPRLVDGVNVDPHEDTPVALSTDGSRLYLRSYRAGTADIFIAQRL